MSRVIELVGGPADGKTVIVPSAAYDLRLPIPPNLQAVQLQQTLEPIPVLVAVYRRPVNPLDFRWRFDGEELLA